MTVRKWSTLVAIKVGLVTKVIVQAITVRKWSALVAIKVGHATCKEMEYTSCYKGWAGY